MKLEDIENIELPYSGVASFFKFPHTRELEGVDIAMVGVPMDMGTTYRSGCRMGPRAIRDASQIYGTHLHEGKGIFDVELGRKILSGTKIIDYGDVLIAPTLTKENLMIISAVFMKILSQGVFPVAFGGDHSISHPILSAFNEIGEKIDIIHFDTHLDFRDDFADGAGLKYSHGSPLKRISELENIDNITQIGIRGLLNDAETVFEAQKYGTNIITASNAIKNGMGWVLDQIPSSHNIYVTLDIDVMDPSVAPGTGTPEPGGFNYHQMKEILTGIPEKGNVIGFDIVEVNPLYDVGEVTSQLAARMALDFLGILNG